jgi:zinc protease
VGMRPPRGVVRKTVKKGIEPKSQAAIVYTGKFHYDQAHRVAIRALTMVMETRLRETLREDLSGTYGVNVSAGYTKVPVERYTLSIGFGCNPERVEDLVKVIFREIGDLKDKGPAEKQVADIREGLLRDYETNSKQNSYLLAQIYLRYQVSEDMKDYYAVPDYYRNLTPAMIQEAAREYLDNENYVQVILLPEK